MTVVNLKGEEVAVAPTSNRMTLDDLEHRAIGEVITWSPEELAMLADDIAALEAKAKKHKKQLNMAVRLKYEEVLKDHHLGTKRIHEADYDVVVNIPKNVSWDNATLARVEMQEGPDGRNLWHYLDVKRTVPEAIYDKLEPEVARIFEAARTVKAGSQTVKFERKEKVA